MATSLRHAYVPAGDCRLQLIAGNALVGVAVLTALASIGAAAMLGIASSEIYGLVWLAIAVITCGGFQTKPTYTSEDKAWAASNIKLIGALISMGLSGLVWVVPTLLI